jgi:hypothetical protein
VPPPAAPDGAGRIDLPAMPLRRDRRRRVLRRLRLPPQVRSGTNAT